jgi:hypothetical protein
MHMTFMFKHAHNIDVQTIQVDEWHLCLFHMNLWKTNFAQPLLQNHDPWNLWCTIMDSLSIGQTIV